MTTSSLSRRSLLGGALGLAATAAGLSACSPGSAGAPGQEQSVAGGGGSEGYDGPAVSLAFWNGLTGGDGPIMRKMINQFNAEHPNIKVSMTAIAWAEYFQKLPAAVSNGKAPEIGLMHNDDLATNAARQVISPLDDVADGPEAHRGRLRRRSPGTAGSTRTSATASRSTSTRPGSSTTRPCWRRSGPTRRSRRPPATS